MRLRYITPAAFILFLFFAANAQSGRKSVQNEESPKQTEEKKEGQQSETVGDIQPANIYRRPTPDTEVFGRCFRNEGFDYVKTVLRVTFDASAEITAVEVKTPSGCDEFDEASVEAARGIKFEPAVQNGKPITIVKTVIFQGGVLKRR